MHGFSNKEKIDTLEAARKALDLIEESRSDVMSEGPRGIKKIKGFDKKDMLKKAGKDAVFFEHLFEEVVGSKSEAAKAAYDKLITEAMVLAGEILQEADVMPRTVSPIVDYQVLSEDEMVEYYKRSFNLILEQQFNKPNIKSELLFEAKDSTSKDKAKTKLSPKVKGLMIKSAKAGLLDSNDPEAVAKYLSAENATANALSNVLIPQRLLQQISSFQNGLPDGYTSIFGNTLSDKINAFHTAVSKIAAIIAPFIFMNALSNANINIPFNPAQVAGIGLDNSLDSDSNGNVTAVEITVDSTGNLEGDSSANGANN